MDLDKKQLCPNCGSAMQVRMPIWITPGEESIDTGDIDYESDMKSYDHNWICNECDYSGFPKEEEVEPENVYVVPLPEHWKDEVVNDDRQQEIKSAPTHSPAPWSMSGDLVVGAPEPRPNPKVEPHSHAVAKLCWDFDGDTGANGDLPWSIAKANGQLIIAAPELLQALKAILRDCEEVLAGREPLTIDLIYSIAHGKPRAAVAKAQGEQT